MNGSVRFARRLSMIAAALCASTLWCSFSIAAETHAAAGGPTASAALQQLIDGNQRFVAGTPKRPHQSVERRRDLTASQQPIATILSCSDSRVPAEIVFDQGLGDLFVVRVAGNVVGTEDLGSIEYAVQHLHTPLIVVMGHESCGAVTSALFSAEERSKESQAIQELLNRIEPVVRGVDAKLSHSERVHQVVEANVRQSVKELEASADLMHPHEGAAPVIVGAVYELETGKVRILK